MKESTLLTSILLILCGTVNATAQGLYLQEGFDKGIPATFITVDGDGLQPGDDMVNLGFAIGTPWIVVNDGDNKVACSTSWYKSPGTSDDWLITPPFTVDDDNATLAWRAKAYDKAYADGYAVYVSASASGLPEDFVKEEPLFHTLSENVGWTRHSLSLADFKGKTVRVAFVNNSTDCSRLYIDDIQAGIDQGLYITSTMPELVTTGTSVSVTGEVGVWTDDPIERFSVTMEYNGESYTEEFVERVENGKPFVFTLNRKMILERNQPTDYTLTVKAADRTAVTTGSIVAYIKGVLAEEFTGTWCGFCVRGIVALENNMTNYPENFIPLAVHQDDVMECEEYVSEAYKTISPDGLPYAMVMRDESKGCDPGTLWQHVAWTINEDPVAGIGCKAQYNETTGLVNLTAQLHFIESHDDADYKIALVLVENRIHCPDDPSYSQRNYYAGGKYGPMGGFEDLPEVIPADQMYYDHVVRAFFGDYLGIEGSVPQQVEKGVPVDFDYSFSLPDNILNKENLELVVLLAKGDGIVVNAAKTPIDGFTSGIGSICPEEKIPTTFYNLNGQQVDSNAKGLIIIKRAGETKKVIR
ncbi:MAG: choice-of-anchor J domain-containing protein [Lepagella sp.]